MVCKYWCCNIHSSRKQLLNRRASLLGWCSDPHFINLKFPWGKGHIVTWSLKYCSLEGLLGQCGTYIQRDHKRKKKPEWKQQYMIHLYRNKTICVSSVDFNPHSFCVGHIFTVFNFPVAIYTAFLNLLWLCVSWSLVLVSSILLQFGIFERGGRGGSKTLTMKVKFFIPLLISFAVATMPEKKDTSFIW